MASTLVPEGGEGMGAYYRSMQKNSRNVQPYDSYELRNLPRLPVPPLQDTCERYIEYLKPLVSESEWTRTKKLVEKFLDSAESDALQRELKRINEETPTSWLEGWWDSGYLEYRAPHLIHTNPFFCFKDTPSPISQADRAAHLTYVSMEFYNKLRRGDLTHDKVRKTPLCMTQYGRIFATFKLPIKGRDVVYSFPNEEHIVVLCDNQFWRVQVIGKDGRTPCSIKELAQSFNYIAAQSAKTKKDNIHAIPVLTSEDRNAWADTRERIANFSVTNRKNLEIIDRALLVVCLDRDSPRTLDHVSRLLLHTDSRNRWWDKLQIIVFGNGRAGVNMEHSPLDGHTMLRYLNDIHKASFALLKTVPQYSGTSAKLVNRLNFEIQSSVPIMKAIHRAEVAVDKLIARTSLKVLEFNDFGKEFCKKHRISPDGFLQMAYQLSFYKLRKHFASTYESIQVKYFYHGRTECLRVVTNESAEFIQAFANQQVDDAQKEKLFRQAVKKHVSRIRECQKGLGVDRHLLGLYEIAKAKVHRCPGYDMPLLLLDPNYAKLSTSVLSTSNCGGEALQLFGFGPVTGNGFGLGYMIHRNAMYVVVSSFKGEATTFASLLRESLLEFRDLLARPKHNQSSRL